MFREELIKVDQKTEVVGWGFRKNWRQQNGKFFSKFPFENAEKQNQTNENLINYRQ